VTNNQTERLAHHHRSDAVNPEGAALQVCEAPS
jgi:hypothetical protein